MSDQEQIDNIQAQLEPLGYRLDLEVPTGPPDWYVVVLVGFAGDECTTMGKNFEGASRLEAAEAALAWAQANPISS